MPTQVAQRCLSVYKSAPCFQFSSFTLCSMSFAPCLFKPFASCCPGHTFFFFFYLLKVPASLNSSLSVCVLFLPPFPYHLLFLTVTQSLLPLPRAFLQGHLHSFPITSNRRFRFSSNQENTSDIRTASKPPATSVPQIPRNSVKQRLRFTWPRGDKVRGALPCHPQSHPSAPGDRVLAEQSHIPLCISSGQRGQLCCSCEAKKLK